MVRDQGSNRFIDATLDGILDGDGPQWAHRVNSLRRGRHIHAASARQPTHHAKVARLVARGAFGTPEQTPRRTMRDQLAAHASECSHRGALQLRHLPKESLLSRSDER
jgi:hypothetical protein